MAHLGCSGHMCSVNLAVLLNRCKTWNARKLQQLYIMQPLCMHKFIQILVVSRYCIVVINKQLMSVESSSNPTKYLLQQTL